MPEAITVLLIEDDTAAAETIKETVEGKVSGVEVLIEDDFSKAKQRLRDVSPDAVILDLYEDPMEKPSGDPVWGEIWKQRFCPIIFHTAHERPEEPAVPSDHPFVKFVKKRSGSDSKVADHLQEFLPHVSAIRAVNGEIGAVIQSVLKDVTGLIWDAQPDDADRDDILKRTARRRVAAMMDLNTFLEGKPMHNWEQYIVPALGNDVLTGDIIRAVGSNRNDPAKHRLVITPSCDMVTGRRRISEALAAKCVGIQEYLKAAQLDPSTKENKKRERLPALLTQDQCGGYIPLPELPGVIPLMAACMRDMELIPLDGIGNAPKAGIKYTRVASVDSPFRERIAWAYVQISGRPGMPECDMAAFIESIVRATGSSK